MGSDRYMKFGMTSVFVLFHTSVQCARWNGAGSVRFSQLRKKSSSRPTGPPAALPLMTCITLHVSGYWMSSLPVHPGALYADMSPDSRAVRSP